MMWQVTFTEFITEQQFVWIGTASDEANAKQKAKNYFRRRLTGLIEDTDYSCVVEQLSV